MLGYRSEFSKLQLSNWVVVLKSIGPSGIGENPWARCFFTLFYFFLFSVGKEGKLVK